MVLWRRDLYSALDEPLRASSEKVGKMAVAMGAASKEIGIPQTLIAKFRAEIEPASRPEPMVLSTT